LSCLICIILYIFTFIITVILLLSCPILSYPVYPVLFLSCLCIGRQEVPEFCDTVLCPILSYPFHSILSYLILEYPIQSSPVLS